MNHKVINVSSPTGIKWNCCEPFMMSGDPPRSVSKTSRLLHSTKFRWHVYVDATLLNLWYLWLILRLYLTIESY